MTIEQKQQGFSLIELMISITIGLILMTGVVQMFLSSKQVFSTQQGISRIQETGRLAIDFLANDIRQAGYMGCISRAKPNITNTLHDAEDYKWDFDVGIQGYSADPENGSDLLPKPVDDTDILTIRSASGSGATISKTDNAGQLFVTLTTDGTGCPSDLCDGDIVMITDCAKARVFQVTNTTDTGNGVNVVHSNAVGDPGNAISSWGGHGKGAEESFDVGAEVIKMQTTTYYIAKNAEGVEGLWQKVGNNTAYELLEGVEDMSLMFGVDTSAPPNARVDEVVAIAGVADWTLVLSVQVELLVRSTDDNVSPKNQAYTFAGVNEVADDKRIRKVFSSTVGIRSRLK